MTNELQITDTFYKHLYNFIKKRISEPKDVEDILHDSLFRAQRSIDQLNTNTKLTSWLYQIVRMSIIDFYRRKDRLTELDDLIIAKEYETNDNHNAAIGRCLKGMINQLPEKYRTALELTELEGISQVALSEQLGLSKSGAKSRVQRGKQLLKSLFLKCCDIHTDRRGNVVDYQERHQPSRPCGCLSE